MKIKLLITLLLLLGNVIPLKAQMIRFERVKWEVIPESGLSNAFRLRMTLVKKNAKELVVEPESQYYRWAEFKFSGEGLQYLYNGIGAWRIPDSFNGPDSIPVKVECPMNPALNTVFYVPVKYCRALIPNGDDLRPGEFMGFRMQMNTGETYEVQDKWMKWERVACETSEGVTVSNGFMRIGNVKPGAQLFVKFTDRSSGYVLLDKTFKVGGLQFLQLDYSGRSGRKGRDGQPASVWSQAGGNGENGTDGEHAQNLTMYIRPFATDTSMFEIIAFSGNHIQISYAERQNFNVQIIARGGKGGNGGSGGAGADAKIGSDPYYRQNGGAGGNGGYGGNGGDGSNVRIYLDSLTHPDITQITVNCNGGSPGEAGDGGKGGRPDRGNDNLLYRNAEKDIRIHGQQGEGGYSGRNGMFLGFTYLNPAQMHEELRKRGLE